MMTEKKMQLVDCEYSSHEGTLASRVSMPSRPWSESASFNTDSHSAQGWMTSAYAS